ncbi:MAG: hypothetical protein ACPG77_19460, partial [Nannocystaceae bacterium]
SMEALLTDLAYNPRARWGRGIGMLSLVAGAATVGSLFSSPEVAPACQGIGQTFATHWNEARSQALGKVILTTKTPFAATTWERIRPRIDAYAQEIRTAAQQACEETKAHSHVADLRLACLHRCEVELDALVEALQTGGSKSIQRAIRATDALTPISSCDESVLTAQRTAPPRDAAVASAVELLRADLARIKAMRIAGRPREVFETAAAAVERAKELGYLPALAEAHLEHAELYASIIDLKTAEPEYEAAWHAALASDHDRVARDAANFLAGELAYEPPRLGEAKVWIAHADAVALRMGVNDEHTYFNQAALGRVAETEGRFADAIAPMKEAARAGEAAFGPNSWEVISVHAVLSSVLGRSGDL